MKRHQDWPTRLNACIQAARARPFVWGEHDCCLFAADCVLAMTGEDLAAPWRGTYHTEWGAARVLTEQGGLHAIIIRALGYPLASPALARRGDLVIVETEGRLALAVVSGAHAHAPGPRGLADVPMDRWLQAWRV